MGAAAAVAGIGAAASIGGSLLQSSAASKGQSAALAAQQQALAQTRADLEPWRNTGQNALMATGDLSGANGPDAATAARGNFFTSPGYQWRLDEGMREVESSAAAQGMLRSGATMKALQERGQGLASSEFENYYNRLYNLSGMGLKAASGTGDAETQTGRGIASTELGGANAQSSIYGNAASGLGTAAAGLASNPQFQNWWNGGGVSPTTVGNNALYQQAAFNQYPTGTYGPFA